jgi:hypothetical protein
MMLLLFLLSPLAAHAQTSCDATASVDKCFFFLYDERLTELAGQAVQSQVQSRPTGPMAPGSAIGSASQDFLSRFIASLQSAQLDQKNRQLNFAYNLPEEILDSSVKLQTVFYQPEISKNIQDMLTNAGKTADLSALQSKLNDADDVSVMVGVSRQTMHVGRSFKVHREEFGDLYTDAVLKPISASRNTNAMLRDEKIDAVLQIVMQRSGKADRETVKISDVTPISPDFVSDLRVVARSEAELEAERDRLLEDNHLSSFADLLANQPQLSFSFGGRWRDRAVGPNEFDAQASYEMGFVNLNGACPTGKCDPVGFKNYVEKHLRSLQAESSDKTGSKDNRLSLTIDYSRTRDYAFSLPADDVDLQMPRATHWTYALTYARQMVFDKQGKPIGRIDVTGRYENFSDDPLHHDRGTLDLTYTQKVSDTFSLPIGISYANHGEFLGQVDRTLSAHFGLHAKVFGQDQ